MEKFIRNITSNPEKILLDMEEHRAQASRKGRQTRVPGLDEFISLKPGYPIFLGAEAHQGKTEIAFEIILNDIKYNKKNWLIFSPETGSTIELWAELIERYRGDGKRYYQFNGNSPVPNALTYPEIAETMGVLSKHIRTIDPIEDWKQMDSAPKMTLKNLFEIIEKEEKILGAAFDGVLIDPFNEVEIDSNVPLFQFVKNEIDDLIHYGKMSQKVIFITNHTNDVKGWIDTDIDKNKFMFYPPPRPQDWAYGQQWYRKAYQLITYYRPQRQVVDMWATVNNCPYSQHSIENNYNMAIIIVNKSKPKGVGKRGEIKIFYDVNKQKFYHYDAEEHRRVFTI